MNEKETSIEKNYLEQLEAMKVQMATMVSGEEYDRVLAEHKRLTDEYINAKPVVKTEAPTYRRPQEIIKDLRRETNKKVDHIRLSLEYRDAHIRELGKDPWTGSGSVSKEDAQQVADIYQNLLDEYGDDPAEFTYRFDQALVDDPAVVQALKIKKLKQK